MYTRNFQHVAMQMQDSLQGQNDSPEMKRNNNSPWTVQESGLNCVFSQLGLDCSLV
jgi:hypothetical protein